METINAKFHENNVQIIRAAYDSRKVREILACDLHLALFYYRWRWRGGCNRYPVVEITGSANIPKITVNHYRNLLSELVGYPKSQWHKQWPITCSFSPPLIRVCWAA